MTDAVRRMLESASKEDAERPGSSLDSSALGSVCAWCGKVRGPGGRWLPIAQYLPDDGKGRLSHGVCPACRETVPTGAFGRT